MAIIRVCTPADSWKRRFAFYKRLDMRTEMVEGTKQIVRTVAVLDHYWTRATSSPSKGIHIQNLTDEEYMRLWLDTNRRMLDYWYNVGGGEGVVSMSKLAQSFEDTVKRGISVDEVQRIVMGSTYYDHALDNFIQDMELRGFESSHMDKEDLEFRKKAGDAIARVVCERGVNYSAICNNLQSRKLNNQVVLHIFV